MANPYEHDDGQEESNQLLGPRRLENAGDKSEPGQFGRNQRERKACFGLLPRRAIERVLYLVLVLVACVSLGSLALRATHAWREHHRHRHHPYPSHPHHPAMPGDDGHAVASYPIDSPHPPGKPLQWTPPESSSCDPTETRLYPQFFPARFTASHDLSILQEFSRESSGRHHRGHHPHVWGEVLVRPVGGPRTEPGVEVEVITNNPSAINVLSEWDAAAQGLRLVVPDDVPWPLGHGGGSSGSTCIQIRITAWVPRGRADVRKLSLYAVNLDAYVLGGVNLRVAEEVRVATVVGRVGKTDDATLDARIVELSSVSSDVTGKWPLYDLLHIRTVSGDIGVEAQPQPADKARPRPAELQIETVSGDIRVTEAAVEAAVARWCGHETAVPGAVVAVAVAADLPARDYINHVNTKSGHVVLRLATGSLTTADSVSAELDLVLMLLPVAAGEKGEEKEAEEEEGEGECEETKTKKKMKEGPVVTTGSISGLIYLTVLEANADADADTPLRQLRGTHQSISGDLDVRYPARWEGRFEARTMSGRVHVQGDGIRFDSGRKKPGETVVRGEKGEEGSEGSTSWLDSMSGDVKLVVG